jgi:hypothetical protein
MHLAAVEILVKVFKSEFKDRKASLKRKYRVSYLCSSTVQLSMALESQVEAY